ncbi:MAG TPA: hypothetical protein PKA00_00225 [Saprospiraceae bacterium]|nr:hypothetical protein [Saprospiraceae bacterium]HMQ81289.1 hypothetical protein [Saprospiraceae bacterium]
MKPPASRRKRNSPARPVRPDQSGRDDPAEADTLSGIVRGQEKQKQSSANRPALKPETQ